MNKEKNKTSDIGIKLKVKKQDNQRYNKVYFNKKFFDVGDIVYVISEQEHQQLTTQHNEIISLKSKITELKQHTKHNNEDNESITKYKQELQNKYDLINDLTISNNENTQTIEDLEKAIKLKDNQIIKQNKTIDKQEKEITHLQTIIANDGDNIIEYKKQLQSLSDERNKLLDINAKLSLEKEKDIDNIKTSLNETIADLQTNYSESKNNMQVDFQKQEKELKETIKKQQLHIDELTNKYQSLLITKDNIPQKQHYNEIKELTTKLNDAEKELASTKASIETKLTLQKSELEIAHTNEKAQLIVAYNTNINNLKHEKNNIIKEYNDLLEDVESLTRINTLWNGKHKEIIKNKVAIELDEIPSEQLPPSDVLEYVPKD